MTSRCCLSTQPWKKVARRDWERALHSLHGQMGKWGECRKYKSFVNCQGLGTEYKIWTSYMCYLMEDKSGR